MIIDIPLTLLTTLIVSLLALIGVMFLLYKLLKFRSFIFSMLDAIQSTAMTRDDLQEYVQRQFILLLKDDRLFRHHVEKRILEVTTKK